MWFLLISSIKYWNTVKTDNHLLNLYINTLFMLYVNKKTTDRERQNHIQKTKFINFGLFNKNDLLSCMYCFIISVFV